LEELGEVKDAFEAVYSKNLWNHGSGPGSLPSSTIDYRAFIERFILENDIRTVTDLGCGDWQFSKLVNWSSVTYTGLDVVPHLVDQNNQRFANKNISFKISEGYDSLPGGDLLLCKEVLQHLPNRLIFSYLNAISDKYRYALITNSIGPGWERNTDISPGGYRPLKLEAEPFKSHGAVIFVYYPRSESQLWRNAVFLLMGNNAIRQSLHA
jgi:SAM-dependent methyltransferase